MCEKSWNLTLRYEENHLLLQVFINKLIICQLCPLLLLGETANDHVKVTFGNIREKAYLRFSEK